MGEAIFAKYSKGGGIPPELKISDYTKYGLGLNANATLDDCLRQINSIDVNSGLAIIKLKDIDGTPLGDHNIRITDAGGLNVVYTTDGKGECRFTTINNVMNVYDWSNNTWFDVACANALNVNIPIGSVQQITLQRTKNFVNGQNIMLNYSMGNQNFSKYANTVDVEIKSANGGSAIGAYTSIPARFVINTTWYTNVSESNNKSATLIESSGRLVCTGYYSYVSNNYLTNQRFSVLNSISGVVTHGYLGSIKRENNIDIHNKNNVYIKISSSGIDRSYNSSFSAYYYDGNVNHWVFNFPGAKQVPNNQNLWAVPRNTSASYTMNSINLYPSPSAASTGSFGNVLSVTGGAGGTHSSEKYYGDISSDCRVQFTNARLILDDGSNSISNSNIPSRCTIWVNFLNMKASKAEAGYIHLINFQYK